MAKIIFQADDYGITPAATQGVVHAVNNGFIRATGVFTNRPSAPRAIEALRHWEGLDLGMDLNLVTGSPLLPAEQVPDLVTGDGTFRTSHQIRAEYELVEAQGMKTTYAVEPFGHEQTMAEANAQYERFVELAGRKPAYLHHHSIITPGIERVIHQLGEERSVKVMDDLIEPGSGVNWVPNTWYTRPFDANIQADAKPIEEFEAMLDQVARHDISILITHPGYVDAELLDITSYHVIRARELELVTSGRIAEAMRIRGIEVTSLSAEGLI
ncbi:MAG: ChbG/HpnK family deacetylase [Tessaracoccus sp.]